MQNPNNVTLNIRHELEFIAKHGLDIPTFKLLNDTGELFPGAQPPELGQETALKIYETMRFIRLLDERMQAAQRQGRISFYMQCSGEEAAVTAATAALKPQDMIMAQYREQAALHYRGFSLQAFMDQLFSTEHDLGKGRQMPIHYGSSALNYMTISSPLGTQIPQAAGYAYGQKLPHLDPIDGSLKSKIEACTLCFFGEGAASEGDFHAGLNMAAVSKAPVIFFVRNNGYAISTPAEEQFSGDGIAARGTGYGITSIRVDGMDALAVYAAVEAARKIATEQSEPVLIEAIAYRVGAHSTSDDPSGYRSKEEENNFRRHCPVARFKAWLIKQDWLDDKIDQQQVSAIKNEILSCLKATEIKLKPSLGELVTDVYSTVTPDLKRQLADLKEHIKKYPDAYPVTSGRLK